MSTSSRRTTRWLTAVSIVMTPLGARAQDTAAAPKSGGRTTGLPSNVEWTFNFNPLYLGFYDSLADHPASFVGAFAHPRAAVQQSTGRTKAFTYGMVHLAYNC